MYDNDVENEKLNKQENRMRPPAIRPRERGDYELYEPDETPARSQSRAAQDAFRKAPPARYSPRQSNPRRNVSGPKHIQNVPPDPGSRGRDHKDDKRRANKTNLIVSRLLLGFAVVFLAVGIYLLVKPSVVHKKQDQIASEILEQLIDQKPEDTGHISIEVNVDDINIPGSYSDEYDVILPPGETAGSSNETKPAATTHKPGTVVTIKSDSIMRIAKINLEIPVAPDINATSLFVLPGHYPSSPQPGEIGVTSYFGHRMYGKGRHFNRLNEVTQGDTIKIQRKGMLYTYVVDSSDIVEPSELGRFIYESTDKSRIVLVTCHPKQVTGVPKYRIVVRGHLESAQPVA